ncbi:bifunctional biotin--[acetyl-CoA-carboxylase] ligase/biotin operon repressor BirA [Enterobacteriaceae bacterium LUAb1]
MKANHNMLLKLVNILADGALYSGEQLGRRLGVSQADINKYMPLLQGWGLNVVTEKDRGYSLPAPLRLLNKQKITAEIISGKIIIIPVIGSTNQYLLDNIGQLQSGDVCVAEFQQSGRGRRGRQWFSPFGTNLYFSMYWCLNQGATAATGLSLVIGIVIAEVLQRLGAEGVRVKWPNDLYLNDKKLAGILVELTGRAGEPAHIVLGAGINLAMRTPDTRIVNQDWINLEDAGINIDRNILVICLIKQLRLCLQEFERDGLSPFIERWAVLDNFLNREVKLLTGKQEIHGIVRGIDFQGGLLLENNGKITTWAGGEISLRAK